MTHILTKSKYIEKEKKHTISNLGYLFRFKTAQEASKTAQGALLEREVYPSFSLLSPKTPQDRFLVDFCSIFAEFSMDFRLIFARFFSFSVCLAFWRAAYRATLARRAPALRAQYGGRASEPPAVSRLWLHG